MHTECVITLGNSRFRVIDLTQPLRLDAPVYPGDPLPQRKLVCDYAGAGCRHYTHELGDHVFQPHADAPNHQNPALSGQGMETFDITYSYNNACLIDLSHAEGSTVRSGVRYLREVRRTHLEPFSAVLAKRSAVVIRSGYDLWLEQQKQHTTETLPYLHREAAQLLASLPNLRVVGFDSLTVDKPGCNDAHRLLNKVLITEALVHLHQIPRTRREDFVLQTSPVRIIGATGGPVVAHALVPG